MGSKNSGRRIVHVLAPESINTEFRTATCALCGPVRIYEAKGTRKRARGVQWVCGKGPPERQTGGPMQHELADMNTTALTAECAVCGPTDIVWRPYTITGKGSTPGRWVCAVTDAAEWRRWIARDLIRRLKIEQQGKCAACTGPLAARCAIDRDPATKRPKGLLCAFCVNALKRYERSSKRLRAIAEYLEAHTKPID